MAAFEISTARVGRMEMGGGGETRRAPVLTNGGPMDRKRALITMVLLGETNFALLAALTPRVTYSVECKVCSRFLPVYNALQLEPLDEAMLLVAVCFILLAGFRCWRASSVLAGLDVPWIDSLPTPLHLASWSVLSMPIWLVPLVDSFGKPAILAAAVLWMLVPLSMLCYVGALAACEIELRGEEPGTLLLSAGYHLGGARAFTSRGGSFRPRRRSPSWPGRRRARRCFSRSS